MTLDQETAVRFRPGQPWARRLMDRTHGFGENSQYVFGDTMKSGFDSLRAYHLDKEDKMTKKQIEKLKKELEIMTVDRDSSIDMYQTFFKDSVKRGKVIEILMPMINQEKINDALAELYDLKKELEKLESQKEFLRWQIENPGKGFTDFLLSLGDFKDIPID